MTTSISDNRFLAIKDRFLRWRLLMDEEEEKKQQGTVKMLKTSGSRQSKDVHDEKTRQLTPAKLQ